MGPRTEQLVRDYLNRVSVAARTRLRSDDRLVLLARTRERIERRCGAKGGDPVEVARVLASLGSPEGVVDRERARLARDRAGGADGHGGRPGQWRRRMYGWVPRQVPGPGAGADAAAESPAPPPPMTGDTTVHTTRPISARRHPAEPRRHRQPHATRPWRLPGGPESGADAPEPGQEPGPDLDELAVPSEPAVPGEASVAAAEPAAAAAPAAPAGPLARRDPAAWLTRDLAMAGRAAVGLWLRHPLEVTAVVLVGAGGLLLPSSVWLPGLLLWLLGASAAMASRLWDQKDKWLGILGPVVVVIAGIGVWLMHDGWHHSVGVYGHEMVTGLVVLVRVAAVLGAVYLGWRVKRGPRTPSVPPWNRPHRI